MTSVLATIHRERAKCHLIELAHAAFSQLRQTQNAVEKSHLGSKKTPTVCSPRTSTVPACPESISTSCADQVARSASFGREPRFAVAQHRYLYGKSQSRLTTQTRLPTPRLTNVCFTGSSGRVLADLIDAMNERNIRRITAVFVLNEHRSYQVGHT